MSFMTDCPVWRFGWDVPQFAWGIDFPLSSNPHSYTFRHGGGRANMLYYDGHVESVLPFEKTGKYLFNWKYP